MKLRIVLVEPKEAGNVGAAARAMKNFGFEDLWIVGRHPALHPLAGWWASGAGDVVEKATFVETLSAALADAHLTIGTTSSRGRRDSPELGPSELASLVSGFDQTHIVALVFGREDSGLTRDELMLCQISSVIPTSPGFPTMNLAQSVGIFCYELSLVQRQGVARKPAAAGMIERLHERAQSLLMNIGFLHASNPDRIYDDLRAIAGRATIDEREATILLGILRQLEWAVRER